mmetsp:Transcript_22982/g.64021  ORF Transcript_22982/g.64021 Transcript_22982/m.64021 type:complete len:254 (+) Transcript_22982:1886-2647(+)
MLEIVETGCNVFVRSIGAVASTPTSGRWRVTVIIIVVVVVVVAAGAGAVTLRFWRSHRLDGDGGSSGAVSRCSRNVNVWLGKVHPDAGGRRRWCRWQYWRGCGLRRFRHATVATAPSAVVVVVAIVAWWISESSTILIIPLQARGGLNHPETGSIRDGHGESGWRRHGLHHLRCRQFDGRLPVDLFAFTDALEVGLNEVGRRGLDGELGDDAFVEHPAFVVERRLFELLAVLGAELFSNFLQLGNVHSRARWG